MAASVPELVMRTRSSDGIISHSSSAIVTSPSAGAPKLRLLVAACCTASTIFGWA